MTTLCKRLTIHGRVQGVYYRASAVAEAERFGVSGWVRNRRDGTVEALACGDAHAVASFIAWVHEGPPGAHVTQVDVADAAVPAPEGFSQLPSA
ncbi:acylphosphatase [Crenobacter cavernae]|uniref:acylphosphatase n=1 Tax=Crenobacter cavernae TaxID=2290923 RepID=A0ABY0FG03_9NEIS|nr:acylphosphatase [Crenobacter cavernae]RXZ45321.1 acylphosphatase [Crenobacter cavernae]